MAMPHVPGPLRTSMGSDSTFAHAVCVNHAAHAHARTRARAHTHTHARAHTHAHTHTHTHTHTYVVAAKD